MFQVSELRQHQRGKLGLFVKHIRAPAGGGLGRYICIKADIARPGAFYGDSQCHFVNRRKEVYIRGRGHAPNSYWWEGLSVSSAA